MKTELEIDEFLATILSSVARMVASGEMSDEQALDIRSRAPMVKDKLLGKGPLDWVDAFAESSKRNIESSALSRKEKDRLYSEISDGKFVAMMRLYGAPDWLGPKSGSGERGRYLSDALNTQELSALRHRELAARALQKKILGASTTDVHQLPTESDSTSTLDGSMNLASCERFEKRPESPMEFVEAMELQALSVSLANRDAMVTLMGDDCGLQSMRSKAVWAKNGFPFVHIRDAKWCASLCATSVPPELAEMIAPPWSCFRIAIPQGLLSVELDTDGERAEDCTRLMAMYDDNAEWTLVLEGSSRIMHLTGERTSQLCEAIDVEKRNIAHDPGLALTDRDGRVMRLAARLVLAVCISMDRKEEWPEPTRKRLSLLGPGRQAKDPVVRQYVLRPPVRVRVDARKAIKAYVTGTRKGAAPSVQIMIPGHWKNQPHGPRSSLRKFIHIEPYWRGPADAPIAVRPHILKDPKKKPDDGVGAPPVAAE